jgi:hypothetical protein
LICSQLGTPSATPSACASSAQDLVHADRDDDDEGPGRDILIEAVDARLVRPERSTLTISVPTTLPRPPKRLVPPMTTAVMLSRFAVWYALGSALGMRPRDAPARGRHAG